jgi:hypothetical protein
MASRAVRTVTGRALHRWLLVAVPPQPDVLRPQQSSTSRYSVVLLMTSSSVDRPIFVGSGVRLFDAARRRQGRPPQPAGAGPLRPDFARFVFVCDSAGRAGAGPERAGQWRPLSLPARPEPCQPSLPILPVIGQQFRSTDYNLGQGPSRIRIFFSKAQTNVIRVLCLQRTPCDLMYYTKMQD